MNKKASIIISAVIILGLIIATSAYMMRDKTSKDPNNSTSMEQPSTPIQPNQPEPTAKKLAELQIEDTVVGTGALAQKGDIITVHYTGKLSNGVVFDSSVVRNQPFEFQLGAGMVIEGWDKGFDGMKVGGKRTLSIPSSMAYGMVDQGSIPGGSDLYFDVELLGIRGK